MRENTRLPLMRKFLIALSVLLVLLVLVLSVKLSTANHRIEELNQQWETKLKAEEEKTKEEATAREKVEADLKKTKDELAQKEEQIAEKNTQIDTLLKNVEEISHAYDQLIDTINKSPNEDTLGNLKEAINRITNPEGETPEKGNGE